MSSEAHQPKSIIYRSQDFVQYMSAGLGVLDWQGEFDNEFAKNKFIMKFINQVELAIHNPKLKLELPKDYEYPQEYITKLDRIWNGNTFYGIRQEPFVRKFLYQYPSQEENYYDVIPLPKLKNMIPVNKIADETMLIQLREAWQLKYALEGSSYASLINNAGFMHQMSDGGVPMFSEEDMQSDTMKTYYYSRQVYNSLMEDFDYFFNDAWNHVSISYQMIIDASEQSEFSSMFGNDDDQSNDKSNVYAMPENTDQSTKTNS